MPCELLNFVIAFAPLFFQAGFCASQSFSDRSDSLAGFADCDQRFAGDGIKSGKAFRELSSGSQSGSMEFFARLTDIVKSIGQHIRLSG